MGLGGFFRDGEEGPGREEGGGVGATGPPPLRQKLLCVGETCTADKEVFRFVLQIYKMAFARYENTRVNRENLRTPETENYYFSPPLLFLRRVVLYLYFCCSVFWAG